MAPSSEATVHITRTMADGPKKDWEQALRGIYDNGENCYNQWQMPEDAQNTDTQSPPPVIQNSTTPAAKPAGKTKKPVLFLAILLLVLSAGGASGWAFQQKSKTTKLLTESKAKTKELDGQVAALKKEVEARKATTGEANIDKDAFQSVFLIGGQVYFGKITSISETQIVLEDIYYLRTGTGGTATPTTKGDVSLVKLGNELHGPQDKMFIERKEVQFWENLKSDSEVSKAIAQYKKANP